MSIIEADPSLALQGAMYSALTADAALSALGLGGRVYDNVPATAVFPFVKIGEDVVNVFDDVCGSDTEILSTVRVFSRAVGRIEAKRFAERIRFLLTEQAGFSVAGFRVVIGYCDGYQIEAHTDGRTHQAIIEFRYRLIPVEP